MPEIRTLENITERRLVDAFIEAFADYSTSFSRYRIEAILRRRGFNGRYSFGVFDGNHIVSFVFNGIRVYDGKLTAYDSGTGTVKGYRSKGLTSRLLRETETRLRDKGVERYLLEVLQENAPAVALYDKIGFKVTRHFTCYQQEVEKVQLPSEDMSPATIEATTPSAIGAVYSRFCDVKPSWQNSIATMLADEDGVIAFRAVMDGETVGCIAGDARQGDIMGLGVSPDMRGKGIGTSLLRAFMEKNEAEIVKVLNVDDECVTLPGFLEHCNVAVSVRQYEMIKELQARNE